MEKIIYEILISKNLEHLENNFEMFEKIISIKKEN